MADDEVAGQDCSSGGADPRAMLSRFVNENDEWVRLIVRHVLDTGEALGAGQIDEVYRHFRQEKALDSRTESAVSPLALGFSSLETAEPLIIDKLCDVTGVNALVAGAVIEPHEALTILFGENGTGKTGYSRIFKALAASRTADEMILGNIDVPSAQSQSATVTYRLGNQANALTWARERGVTPFTRMSIFDSPCVNSHVDDDLEYTYVSTDFAPNDAGVGSVNRNEAADSSDAIRGNFWLL